MWANAVNKKQPKSLGRNLVFNLLRCLHVQLIRNLMFLGYIDLFETAKMAVFCIITTLIFQASSRATLVKLRYVWVLVIMEFAGVNGYMLVVNMNRVEQLYGHNLVMLALQVYCQVMPKLTPDILENVLFGEMLVSQVPTKIQNETHNNQFAFPLLFAMQYLVLDSAMHLAEHEQIGGYRLKGWKMVNQRDPTHFYIWLAVVGLFIYFGAQAAYRSLWQLSVEALPVKSAESSARTAEKTAEKRGKKKAKKSK